MNRNRHRVVFNATRGQRMVVGENASSSAGGSARGETSTTGSTWGNSWARLSPLALALAFGTAHAQIVADPSAPGTQRPTILQTGNGLPLVNVQTPSAAGVSRNVYQQFDVQSNGAILNNSRTNVQTQTGGMTAANPWLATGEARVILNEVNSSNPSQLNGYVEVAGRRAEVVIANPAGIQVKGGGFINASGVTLTTGTPVMNSGHLDAFLVRGGTVRIEGLGLDTSTADHATILTRAMQVNASLWAKALTVVTGSNEVKALASGEATQATKIAGTGPAPTFMLDVAAIGGMYAGKIHLVGTEAGLGINNRGSLAAQEGEWVLKADGSLVNTGKVQAKGDLTIQTTGAITNTGADALISSLGNANVSSGTQVSNTAQAKLLAAGTLGVNAAGALNNTQGVIGTDGAVQITAAGIDNTQGTIGSTQSSLNVDSGAHAITNTRGTLVAQQNAALVGSVLNNDEGAIQAAGALGIATGELSNRGGRVQAVGGVDVDTQGHLLDNTAGLISSQGALALRAGELRNGASASQGGMIGSNADLNIQAAAVSNTASGATASNIWSGQTATICATSFSNEGQLSGENVVLSSTADVTNARGASIEASGDLSIAATGRLTNAGRLVANDTVRLQAETIDNTGAGAIFGDRIAVGATTLNNRPEVAGGAAPAIAARQRLDIGVQTLNNEDGALIYSDGALALGGALDATGAATGQVQTLNNVSAVIEAIGDVRIAALALTNKRRNASVSEVQIASQTTQMGMPSWWINGKNEHGKPIALTSNYNAKQYYLLDPSSILSETPLITPDGNLIYRVEVSLDPTDSVYQMASGAYGGLYGTRNRVTASAGTAVLYVEERHTGVSNPDQVAGAPDDFTSNLALVSEWQPGNLSYSGAYGRCTTNCTLLVVQAGYTDPTTTILRNHQRALTETHPGLEVARTAVHTTVEDRLSANAGAPAAIRSGGHMQLAIGNSLTNRYADIQAGGVLDLQASGATVTNEGQTLKRTERFVNTSHTAGQGSFSWTAPDISEVIGHAGGTLSGAQQLNITAQNLTNSDLARSTGLPTSGLGFLATSLPPANAPISVPNNPLFQAANAGSNYLIQGAPAFTGYNTWLGSDYLIANLGSDPNLVHKRLGDGFYEQRLIREQVAQLTGRRFLSGYANDEAQYRALMDSGVAYAKQWNLIPGVALTAEQMAQLTTDLVWLVEREVVLPDGTRTKALVPQVYLRQLTEGDFQASGALLAGNQVRLQIQGDLVNAGGRIEGDSVVADVGRDLSNIGGLMQARSELLASAGRHITISSPTHTTSYSGAYVNQSRTELAGMGEMKVGNTAGARLNIEAGGNVTLQAASVSNDSATGSTTIQAGGDVRLGTVTVASTDNTEYDAKNYQRHSQSQEVGSSVQATGQGHGDVVIVAGHDVVARAANVSATGDLSVQAGNDIRLEAGREVSDSATSVYTRRSGMLSKKSTEEARSESSNVAIGSSFAGGNVVMQAGRDIAIEGSGVNAKDLLLMDAGRDVNIVSAENTASGSYFQEAKQSGFSVGKQGVGYGSSQQSSSGNFSSTTQAGSSVGGGDVLITSGRDTTVKASTVVADDLLGIDAGRDVNIVAGIDTHNSQQSSASKSKGVNFVPLPSKDNLGVTLLHDNKNNGNGSSNSTTAAASTVGSLGGDVLVTAGQRYQQTGGDVLALKGNVDIQAQSVAITEAREARSEASQYSSKSLVLGATPRNALVDAVNGVKNTLDTAEATSETSNSRAQALGAAATALNTYNTAKQVAAIVANPMNAAGVTIDFNLGSSKSQGQSSETMETGRASTVTGGGDVRIVAQGAGADSDILVRGSDVSAGNDALLKAEGDVRLESGQDRMAMQSTNRSSGASIGAGVTFGASNGITFNASANKAEGDAKGQDEIQRNTHVQAGQTARIESGANTTLAGATVKAESVQAEVGGDLAIESRQDTSSFKSDQDSSGWGVNLCIPPFCYGLSSVSVSGAAQNIESEFASVTEQSGLRAGDGGFQVNVQGDTALKGGAITGTDKAVQAGRNQFETGGELSTSDIENHARYEAEGYALSATFSGKAGDQNSSAVRQNMTDQEKAAADTKVTPANGSAGIGEDSGEVRSTTQAAISGIAGNTEARTGDAESGIAPIFDRERVQKEIDAQVKITAEFGKSASKAIGDYATKKYNELKDTDPEEAAKWDEGGIYRVGLHTLVGGLSGGVEGALGAGMSQSLIAEFGEQIAKLDVPVEVKQLLAAAAGAAIGVAVGGEAGAAAGFNGTVNNYLGAADLRSKHQKLADCRTKGDPLCEIRVLKEYESKNAKNTASINYDSVLTEDALRAEKAQLEILLTDDQLSAAAKAEARRSIRELDKAINVIQRSPALQDAAQLGLIALDVATLGQLAAAKVLTTLVVREIVLSRTGKELTEFEAARIANNFYAEGAPIQYGNSVVVTNADEAIFWSGRTDGIGGMDVAQEIAVQYKGKTLEQLIDQRLIKMPAYDPSNPASVQAWIDISTELAKNASGEVRAVLGSTQRPQSIWATYELPALLQNPAVTKITTIDPKTKLETTIFTRSSP